MILNVYKEKEWTSFDVVAKLRGLLKTRRIGHAGTLDPLAEGVLIILTDKDTKRQEEFMKMDKEYAADIAFGATSPTYDLEGPLEYSTQKVSLEGLQEKLPLILEKFTGEFEQEVPQYSAVKVAGKRLYESARAGKESATPLPKRNVRVYSLSVSEFYFNEKLNLPAARLTISCAKGFYVRSLANDLGRETGTGAVLTKLVRTKIGNYSIEDSKLISSFSTLTE